MSSSDACGNPDGQRPLLDATVVWFEVGDGVIFRPGRVVARRFEDTRKPDGDLVRNSTFEVAWVTEEGQARADWIPLARLVVSEEQKLFLAFLDPLLQKTGLVPAADRQRA